MHPDSIPSTSTIEASSTRPARASKPGSEKRRRLDPAEARESILRAAEELLVRDGPEGLRLTEIAARAGVSHPNVLYHFGSVAHLQSQLAQRVAVRLAEDVALAFSGQREATMPIDDAVAAVFRVFNEGGYARLFAWLALSTREPTFDALGTTLERVRAAIAEHPALRGEENAGRRRRVVPAIQLVVVAAIGYGLSGSMVGALFPPDEERPTVPRLLGELLSTTSPATPRTGDT